MQFENDRIIADLMEQLIENGPDGMASAFTALMNLAMRIERERHLGDRFGVHTLPAGPRPLVVQVVDARPALPRDGRAARLRVH